jgi:hypothetical protein
MNMTERKFKNFVYSMIALILMISFMGLAGGSFLSIKSQQEVKMDQVKHRTIDRPVRLKKIMEIEHIETKPLLLPYYK